MDKGIGYTLSYYTNVKFIKIFMNHFLDIYVFYVHISSHSRIFHSFGDVTFAGEGLQILSYAQHLWPLSSKGLFRVSATPTVTRGIRL